MAMPFVCYKYLQDHRIFNDRTALARAIERGFPKPYELAPNTLAWDLAEVNAWLASRPRRTPKTCAKKSASSGN
jgi:predicted DNA-binding transcriptional regulator AlpA